jgi:2-succinyl-6-hydroxy-2,4-cyclohexadiene-1-carboxylate synthase
MSDLIIRGLRYHVDCWGEGRPLLLLHGFTGSSDTWRPFRLAWRGVAAVAVDLVGHGRTELPSTPARATMAECVEDLGLILDALGLERAAVLGYSMGGRLALRFALAQPHRVQALVLEGASPGLPEEERAARRLADERLARLLEEEGIAAFVAAWEALPLWASQARLSNEERERLRLARLACSPAGLALSLRGMGAGHDEVALDRLGELSMPVLLIAGEEDQKYAALARAMAARLPTARLAIVPEAGHAVHLEQPLRFGDLVAQFLDQLTTTTMPVPHRT